MKASILAVLATVDAAIKLHYKPFLVGAVFGVAVAMLVL